MSKNNKFLIILYCIGIIGLFLFSFTQVDLGLTLTRWDMWQGVQKSFQYIGYFNRPLATFLYGVLLVTIFTSYIGFIKLAQKNKIPRKTIWILLFFTAILLTFAYNAFSYDLFNYIFDAKIFTFYHMDPYHKRALDFPTDPMLGFMHWIERVYPYGPVWLVATIPLSFLAHNILLFNLFLFKSLAAVSFLATAYFIGKITKIIAPKYELLSVVFFAFNPLVVIESLVSAHNDIFMMALAMIGIYFVLVRKRVIGVVVFLLSIGIKYATIFFLPSLLLLAVPVAKLKKERIIELGSILLVVAVVIASLRTNFQPWYLLFVLPVASIISHKYYVLIPSIIFSFFSLCHYIPFFYVGNWNNPIPTILFGLTTSAVVLSCMLVIYLRFRTIKSL